MTTGVNNGGTRFPRSIPVTIAAIIAILFGLATIASGGRTLFGGEEARAAAGAVVGFVLWFNFAAGFAYVAAGTGLLARRIWAARLSALIAGATLAVFAGFGLHVAMGGAHEMRTLAAMVLRSVLWVGIAILTWRAGRYAAPR